LAYRRHGSVQVIYHEPVTASGFADRKSLARSLQAQVAAALPWADTAS
jgi:1-acyl-sn-glycerol-3-phosphate acyltransferase